MPAGKGIFHAVGAAAYAYRWADSKNGIKGKTKLMGCFMRAVICVIIVGLGAFIGFGIGGAIATDYITGKSVEWELVPLPNAEKAQQFTTGAEAVISSPSVYIVTEQGRLFVQYIDFDTESEWKEVEQVETGEKTHGLGSCGREDIQRSLQISQPPGITVAQIDCEVDQVERIDTYRYVILDNGEVWRWKMRGISGLGNLAIQMQYSFLYATIGGIVGLVVSLALLRKVSQDEQR